MKAEVLIRSILIVLAACACCISGCPEKSSTSVAKKKATAPTRPLVLLVVDDPQLGRAAASAWRGRTEENLTVRDVSLVEVAGASRLPGDAIVFPSGMIGQLAERGLILPLEPTALEDADFHYRDIFDQVRVADMRWGGQTMATPLGSPQLLLVYRADVFEKAALKPPTDWAEFQQAAERLADRGALGDLAPAADQPWRATIEPLASGWAGQLLLARAASYSMHREQVSPLFRFENMMPLIDQPPFVRAMEELVAAAKAGGYADQRLAPAQVFEEIRAGRCAMAVGWPPNEVGPDAGNGKPSKLRFALLPGSSQAYRFATKSWEPRGNDDDAHVPLRCVAGRMAAVCAASSDPQRAQGLAVWLAGREVSQQISSRSPATTLFRQSQIATSSRWTGALSTEASRQYADVLAKNSGLPRSVALTMPGRLEYLAALDQAVEEALAGTPAAEALAVTAKKWTAITEKLGTEAQVRALSRSLGPSNR